MCVLGEQKAFEFGLRSLVADFTNFSSLSLLLSFSLSLSSFSWIIKHVEIRRGSACLSLASSALSSSVFLFFLLFLSFLFPAARAFIMEAHHRGQSGINDRRRRAAVETRQPRFHNGWREPRRIPGRVRPGGSASDNKGLFPVAGRGTGWHVTTLHTSRSTWNRAAASYRPFIVPRSSIFGTIPRRAAPPRKTFMFLMAFLSFFFFFFFLRYLRNLVRGWLTFVEFLRGNSVLHSLNVCGGVCSHFFFRNFQHLSRNNFEGIQCYFVWYLWDAILSFQKFLKIYPRVTFVELL